MFYITSTNTKSLVKISVLIKISSVSLYRENKSFELQKPLYKSTKLSKNEDFKGFLNSLYQTQHRNPKPTITFSLISENCLLLSIFSPQKYNIFVVFFSFVFLPLSVE